MKAGGAGAVYSHIALVVGDIGRSAEFYERVLGFTRARQVFRGRGEPLSRIMGVEQAEIEGLFMRRGTFVLELLRYGDGTGIRSRQGPTDHGYAHLSFIVPDVAAVMEAASEHGGGARRESLVAVPMGAGQPVVFGFILDPDDNAIELIGHPDEDTATAHAAFLGADSIDWPH